MNTKDLIKIGLCSALLAVSVLIGIPIPFTPILITGQTLALNLVALILKPKHVLISVLIYICLGALGLPVFSGVRGGLAVLLGPTGGFIFGFLIAAPVMSILKGDSLKLAKYLAVTVLAGIPIIYLFGSVWYSVSAGVSILTALKLCALPFMPGDVLKCLIAAVVAVRLNIINHKEISR